MTPVVFDTICASYERQIAQMELIIAALRHDLADERDLRIAADAKIDELREIVAHQGRVIEEARGVGQAMIAAMDAELIVRDEQGRVMLEQGFIE